MADGKPFVLGTENVAAAVSTLVKRGAGPALRLRVDSGPPLVVNSREKVTNLNADALDGKDSSAFYSVGSKVADSAHADRADWAADAQKLDGRHAYELRTGVAQVRSEGEPLLVPVLPEHITYGRLSIKAPAPGYLRLNGNVSFFHDQSDITDPQLGEVPGSGMVQGLLRRLVGDGYVDSVPSYEDLKGRQYANLALDGVFFVGEGEETVEIWLARGWEGPGVGPIYAHNGVLTAEYAFYNLSD